MFLYLFPITVFAKNMQDSFMPIPIALFVEAFVSVHMSLFVLKPLAELFANEEKRGQLFWTMFIIRAVFLIIMNFFTTFIAVIDFLGVFIGAMVIVPIATLIKKPQIIKETLNPSSNTLTSSSVQITTKTICPNCKIELPIGSKFCSNCGTPISENNPVASNISSNKTIQIANKVKCPKCGNEMALGNVRCVKCGTLIEEKDILTSDVILEDVTNGNPLNLTEYEDYLTDVSESNSLKSLITRELTKNDDYKSKTLPLIEKRKTILTFIYTIIIFIITTIFFLYHSKNLNYINSIGLVITIIYIIIYKNYNLVSHLAKEVKSRPDEKINYIISSTLSGTINTKKRNNTLRLAFIIAVLMIQVGIYREPHLIFEKYNEGYAVRYYTYGILKKDKELTIPSHYKGKQIISIRGDVFENLSSLEKVNLPETLQEIRGGAFKYCKNLSEINIPSKITEIRGNTFEGCTKLYTIKIPEGVTRIGGSAFRDCTNLTEVEIPKTVTEIGSSAFRNTKISRVCLSINTYVNERAFKETYPSIGYYENGCVEQYDNDQYGYNNNYYNNE